MSRTNYKYTCEFCGKNFVRESAYTKHRCEQMERHENLKTLVGQAALGYYKKWFDLKRRRLRNPEGFLQSIHYKPIMKFAEFANRVRLPEPETFIRFVVDKNYGPNVWCHEQVYREYLEYLDRQGDPRTQAAATIKTILRFAEEHDCSFEEFFDRVTTPELVSMIYGRRLSPWLLLHSPKFNRYLQKSEPYEKSLITNVIRPSYWTSRFQKDPSSANYMNAIVKRLKL